MRIEGRNKAANAIVAAGSSHQNFVFDDKRSAGCAVVLVPLRIRHVPDQIAGARIQAEQMRVVRLHVNPVVPHPTPRLMCPDASSINPSEIGHEWCHTTRPVRASSAEASFAAVTNIIPFTTTGVTSSRPALRA